MIVETEIPLAIVEVSLSQYCNPRFNFKKLMFRNSLKDTSGVLALDIQDVMMSIPSKDGAGQSTAFKQVLIPDTEYFMQDNLSDNENDRIMNSMNLNKARPGESQEKNVKKKLTKPASSEICRIKIKDDLSNDLKFGDKKTVKKKSLHNLKIIKAKPALEIVNDDDIAVLQKEKTAMKRKL